MNATEVVGPDWRKLREIRHTAEEAEQRAKLSYEKWKQLLDDAMVAAQGNPELVDFLVPFARPGWKERLAQDQTDVATTTPTASGAKLLVSPPAPVSSAQPAPTPLVEAPPAEEKYRFPKIKWKSRW